MFFKLKHSNLLLLGPKEKKKEKAAQYINLNKHIIQTLTIKILQKKK